MSDEDPTTETPATTPAATAAVANVSVKLPPFWPSDPEVWFAQVEAHFTTRHITAQKTRFDYVIASLSPEVAKEVRDLILKYPEATPYATLKEQLIKRTAASERWLQQLFSAEELGDHKPSQLLCRMQQLLGDRVGVADSTFLRELFLQCLPSNVRMVLASTSATMSLEELAELADKIAEVAAPTIAATTALPPSPQLLSEVQQLRTEVRRLQNSVRTLSHQSQGRSSSRNRQSSPTPHPADNSSMCWYHQKLVRLQRNANPHAPTLNSQTTWPAVNGDGRVRPPNLSLITHH